MTKETKMSITYEPEQKREQESSNESAFYLDRAKDALKIGDHNSALAYLEAIENEGKADHSTVKDLRNKALELRVENYLRIAGRALEEGDYKRARKRLEHAQRYAKEIGMDISEEASGLKEWLEKRVVWL